MNHDRYTKWLPRLAAGLLVAFLSWGCLQAGELPAAAAAALQKVYPGAEVCSVTQEEESGTNYYSVIVKLAGKQLDIEISPSGVIGEAETAIEQKELPAPVSAAITAQLAGKPVVRVERHERRGKVENKNWVSLAAPVVFYEIKYKDGEHRCSIALDENGKPAVGEENDGKEEREDGDDEQAVPVAALPAPVTTAIQSAYPGAKITSASKEEKDLYEVKFSLTNRVLEAKVDATGKLSKVKEHLTAAQLPALIAASVQKTFPNMVIKEVEKVLSGDKEIYQIELTGQDRNIEAEFDGQGALLRQKAEADDEDERSDKTDKD